MTSDRPMIRWGGALAVVLCVHAGAVVATLAWASQQPATPLPPPAAVMIDLAPLPAAPPAEEKKEEKPPEKPEPPKPPKPAPRPKPKPKPKPAELALPQAPKPPDTPPPPAEEVAAPPLPAAPAPVAPAPGPTSVSAPSNAVPTWQGLVLAHLERHKRYPRAAQIRRQQGVTYVAFTIDRQGNVLTARLHKSSGHDSLDQETLDLLQRAQPLPPPPADITGERIELLVPMHFLLNKGW